MNHPTRHYLFALLLVACGASEDPPPPLACSASIVSTADGDRLLVSCNRAVPAVPDACELVAAGTYQCNILHATDPECAAFPGICP